MTRIPREALDEPSEAPPPRPDPTLQPLGAGRNVLPAAPPVADDDLTLGDDASGDDSPSAGSPLVLAGYTPPTETPAPRGPAFTAPPPEREPRLDERYRVAQAERGQASDLDWLLRFTGGPQPPPAPGPEGTQPPTTAGTGTPPPAPGSPPPTTAPPPAAPGTRPGVLPGSLSWLDQTVGRIFPGLVSGLGSFAQSPDTLMAARDIEDQRRRRLMLEAADAIDRGERPPQSPGDSHFGAFVVTYHGMTPEQRQAERTRIQTEITSNVPVAIAERAFYRAGESIKEWARQSVPHVEGYGAEDWSTMVGEGLGSLLSGIPIALATGPAGSAIFFGGLGMSEATERAIQFDRTERAAGRPGLSDEVIALAGLSGVIPGSTDAAAIEVLLGRLRLPGMTPRIRNTLAQAIAARGGAALIQAGVEGIQEGVQETLQNLIAMGYNPAQTLLQNVPTSMGVAGIVGGIAGGAIGRPTPGPQPPPGQPPSGQPPPAPGTPPPTVEPPPQLGQPPPVPGQPPPPPTAGPPPLPETPPPSELERMLRAPPDAPLVERIERALPPRADFGVPDHTLARWMYENLSQGEWAGPAPAVDRSGEFRPFANPVERGVDTTGAAPATAGAPRAVNLDMIRLTEPEVGLAMQALMTRTQWYEAGANVPRRMMGLGGFDRTALQQAHKAAAVADRELRRRLGNRSADALINDVIMHHLQADPTARPSFDQMVGYVRQRFGIGGSGTGGAAAAPGAPRQGPPPVPGAPSVAPQPTTGLRAIATGPEWQAFLTERLGTNKWVVAPRLTQRLKDKGYEVAVPQKRFSELEQEFISQQPTDSTSVLKAASGSPNLPQSIARAISGADETLETHWNALSDRQKADIRERARVMPPHAALEHMSMEVVRSALRAGKPVTIDPHIVEETHRALAGFAPLLRSAYKLGVLKRAVPQGEWVGLTFQAPDGKDIRIATPMEEFLSVRAALFPSDRVVGIVRGFAPRRGVAFSDDLVEHFRLSLGGEFTHELAHIELRILDTVDPDGRLRLVRHARDSLGVLEIVAEDYFKAIGREDAIGTLAGRRDVTLRDLYQYLYRNRANRQQLVEDEAVTNMVELAHHGVITQEQLAPVMDDLRALFAQNLPMRAPRPSGGVEAAFGYGPQFPQRGWASPVSDWEEAIARHFRLERKRGNFLAIPASNFFILANAFASATAVANPTKENIAASVALAGQGIGLSLNHIRDIINIRTKLVESRQRARGGTPPTDFQAALGDVGRSQRADLDRLGFYSQAIEAAKAWKQGKGTAEQARAHLRSAGVKEAELQTVGLDRFFGGGPSKTTVDVYHGSTADVSGGLKAMARTKGQVPAISLATTRDQAKAFTVSDAGKPTKGSSITRARLDSAGFREVDWVAFASSQRWNPNDWQRLLRDLRDTNTPGALVKGMTDAGGSAPQYVVLNASRLLPPAPESITRSDLVSFLEGNRVEVRETVYGGPPKGIEELIARRDQMLAAESYDPLELRRVRDAIFNAEQAVPRPKWSSHSLDPSNPTYRETVIHLPGSDKSALQVEYDALLGELSAMQARGVATTAPEYQELGGRVTRTGDALRTAQFVTDFRSGHFPEPNVIGHVQSSIQVDAKGDPTFAVSQVQSDWSQQIRGRTRDAVAKQLFDPSKPEVQARIEELKNRGDAASKEANAFLLGEPAAFLRSLPYPPGKQTPSGVATDLRYMVKGEQGATQSEIDKATAFLADPRYTTPFAIREEITVLNKVDKGFQDLTPNLKAEVSAAISEARQRGELPAGARDEAKIAELEKRLGELKPRVDEAYSVLSTSVDRHKATPNQKHTGGFLGARSITEASRQESDAYFSLKQEQDRLDAELKTARAAVPSHPFVNTTDQWLTTTLRRIITQAVAADTKSISIPSGKTVLSYNPGKEEGMEGFYDRIVPQTLTKILRELDPSIKPHKVEKVGSPVDGRQLGEGFTVFPLTQRVTDHVEDFGLPLFAAGGVVPERLARIPTHEEASARVPDLDARIRALGKETWGELMPEEKIQVAGESLDISPEGSPQLMAAAGGPINMLRRVFGGRGKPSDENFKPTAVRRLTARMWSLLPNDVEEIRFYPEEAARQLRLFRENIPNAEAFHREHKITKIVQRDVEQFADTVARQLDLYHASFPDVAADWNMQPMTKLATLRDTWRDHLAEALDRRPQSEKDAELRAVLQSSESGALRSFADEVDSSIVRRWVDSRDDIEGFTAAQAYPAFRGDWLADKETEPLSEAEFVRHYNALKEGSSQLMAAFRGPPSLPPKVGDQVRPITEDGSLIVKDTVTIDGFVERDGERFAQFKDPETGETKFWPVARLERAGPPPLPPSAGLPGGIPPVPPGAGGAPPIPPQGPPGIPAVPPGTGGAPPLPAGQFSREFKFNWGAIETQDHVKAMAGQLMDTFRDEMVARGVSGGGRGYVQSWQETAQKAGMLNAVEMMFENGRAKGMTYDAAGMEAMGRLYVSSMEQVKALVTKAASPLSTAEDLIAMRHMLTVHRMVQQEFWGGVSEAGRTLNILRKVRGASQEYSRGLEEIVRNAGGEDTNRELARAIADHISKGNYVGADKVIQKSRTAKTLEAVIEIWKAGLLSGPETHLVNFTSNLLVLPWQMLVRQVAAGIGAILHPTDGVKMGEALAMASGAHQSLREAITAFAESFRTGQQVWGQGQTEAPMVPRTSAEALGVNTPEAWRERGASGDLNRLGAVLQGQTYQQMWQNPETMLGLGLDMFSMTWTTPFRALGASDSFFKVLNNGMEIAAQALRQAEQELQRGEIAPDRMRARYRELVDNPTEEMRIAARDFAEYNTFTNAPGPITRMWERTREWNNPVGRFAGHLLFPFTRTPGNLLAYAFLDHTPLGLRTDRFRAEIAAGGARADLALAKMGLGTILLTVAIGLAMDGWITGTGPDDPEKKQAWMRSGWRPLSVRIPNGTNPDGSPRYIFVPINRIDPIASIPLLGAELVEALQGQDMRYTRSFERAWASAVFAISEIAMSKATMQGFANIMKAATDPDRYAYNFVRRTAASAVPTLSAFITNQTDPVVRSAHDIITSLKARIPGLSSQLPPRLDFWGREVNRPHNLGVTWNPTFPLGYSTTTGAAQPIDRELGRLNYFPGHPHELSVLRSEDAARRLEGFPSRSRARGIDALIAATVDDPVRGESNSVPLRDLPHVQARMITLTSATSASTLLRDNEEFLDASRHRDVARRLADHGNRTLLEALNDLVTNNADYRAARDDQRLQAIRDIIRDYRTAARAQVVREFPELQQLRDSARSRQQGARPVPF